MDKEQLDKVRKASKSPDSPAWKNWYEEMCKKAVLRRASKYITLDDQRLHEMIERLDAMFDFQSREPVRADPFQANFGEQALIDSGNKPEDPPEESAEPPAPLEDPTDEELAALQSLFGKLFDSLSGTEHGQTSADIHKNRDVFKDEAKSLLETNQSIELAGQLWASFEGVCDGKLDAGTEKANWQQLLQVA